MCRHEVNVTDVVTQMIRRAASASFETWWKKVEEVGFCANPIHLIGGDGLGRDHQVFTRCNNRRAIVCPSCSDLYARDTWQLIHAGLRGGHHEIPTTVAEHPQVFVTLTAPSFGAVHTTRTTGSCHPQAPTGGNARTGVRAGAKLRTTTTIPRSGSRCVMTATTMSDTYCSPGMLQNSGVALRFSFGGS